MFFETHPLIFGVDAGVILVHLYIQFGSTAKARLHFAAAAAEDLRSIYGQLIV